MQSSLYFKKNESLLKSFQQSYIFTVLIISSAAFVVYTCMYGFRKPFTVGTYNHQLFLGINYKVCLVIAQVIGYMISKFYGIQFIGKIAPHKRAITLIYCILLAWLTLFLFAIVLSPYNIIFMFLNGLPLGIVFGLVFGYLEGRRTTEIMGAFLVTSFIFASGLAKTLGKWMIIDLQVSDWWMPFLTGSIFIIPFLFAVWILDHSPKPTEKDIAQRTARKPISRKEQLEIIKKFKNVLIPIVISYAVFTIVRDFIEDFANEFWIENGYADKVGIFAQTSTLVSIIVLIIIALFFLFKSNYIAFKWIHILVLVGLSLLLGATFLYNIQVIDSFTWMVIATTGLYFSYLPFNCLYFERFIAVYKINGNVGFVMYIADAFGYLGTVLVLLIKELLPIHYQWNTFFTTIFYSAGIIGIILITFTFIIHRKKLKNQYV